MLWALVAARPTWLCAAGQESTRMYWRVHCLVGGGWVGREKEHFFFSPGIILAWAWDAFFQMTNQLPKFSQALDASTLQLD